MYKGLRDQCREVFKKGQHSTACVAEKLQKTRQCISAHVTVLHKRGEIYIAAWHKHCHEQVPYYSTRTSNEQDQPKPENATEKAWKLLTKEAITIVEIGFRLGISYQTARQAVKRLRKQLYIAGWEKNKTQQFPCYKQKTGNETDAPPPKLKKSPKAGRRISKSRIKNPLSNCLIAEAQDEKKHRIIRDTARKAYETGGCAAIDPLLAIVMRLEKRP